MIVSVGGTGQTQVSDLKKQALLEIARRDANRVKLLDLAECPLDVVDRPVAHRDDVVDRRHEVAVVVEIADDGRADLADPLVVGLHGELPHQVVGE